MGAADLDLLSVSYWQSNDADLRVNPLAPVDEDGLAAFLSTSPELRGHVLFPTSGSSGEPKLVGLSRQALLASAELVNAHLKATEEDRWLCALPTFHVGGFGVWARAYVAGARVEPYQGKWRAETFQKLCAEKRITLSSLVPVQVFDLVDKQQRAPESLRAVIVGGGRLSEELGQKARELGWPVLQSYGMTETASQVATQQLDSLTEAFENQPIPLVKGWGIRSNALNSLEFRGPGLFSGYVRRKSGRWILDPAALDEHGWFVSEDLGRVEERQGDSWVWIQGRRGRVVKMLGELVAMDGLEQILANTAGESALQFTLHAAEHPRRGHEVWLVSEKAQGGGLVEAVREAFNKRVAPYEQIQRVVRVETIPRSPLGKVQRSRLERLLDDQ